MYNSIINYDTINHEKYKNKWTIKIITTFLLKYDMAFFGVNHENIKRKVAENLHFGDEKMTEAVMLTEVRINLI